ncbi:acyl dehydratase [Psychromicrobium silvestre]|uniref:Acyl dehydratase n=1 Tax=Psychromicrobium silvestre TaxID=1645614 RepID=A0A7Y9LRG5_9MICC|nr:acyl dehydratase [Psychromicrobium silvestre]
MSKVPAEEVPSEEVPAEDTGQEAGASRRVIELSEPPVLSKLYAKAATAPAFGALGIRKSGKSFPAVEYRLSGLRAELKQLRDFNRLMHGSDRDELPAGFVHIMAFPSVIALMSADGYPLPLLGAVHLENRVQQHRRIDPAERLAVRVWAQNPALHRVGTQVELAVEVSAEQAGDVVWTGVSTYLSRGVRLAGLDQVEGTEHEKFTAPDANARWTLGSDIGRRYAAVSGDINPIHLSSLSARALGMKRAIAHGMYLASRALTDAKPAGLDAFGWDVRFATPTFIPGTVALRFQEQPIDSVAPETGVLGSRGAVAFQGWNQRNGKPHFSGSVHPLS